MDITNNYFEVFGLPVEYDINLRQLSERYHDLQRQFHPDRHVAKTARERRLSEQYTTFVNQAYGELKSPLQRAEYLLGMMGADHGDELLSTLDPDFLMEQMSLREALAEVREADDSEASLQEVANHATSHYAALQREFSEQYSRADVHSAADTVARMQFFYKLLKEIEQLEHELDDY
ncbi:Fe-S protein assembly co-chaperone HscB [uncultured Porticoccus sp.]|uniref:Fe-S protein assembly co-chaperone HscB n=1 Tax=uncultured Porticoccus sp. TaxID=1256050 RepID=UPI0026151B16|nr:Fe-S protein assembly co-chaperone HscB [uncultured Porticoccus sp.]